MATIKPEINALALMGKTVKDRITGYEGVVEVLSFWLTGCVNAGIRGKLDKDGKVPELEYFDTKRLECQEAKKVTMDEENPGGPTPRVRER